MRMRRRIRLPRLLGFAALSANLQSFADIGFQPKPQGGRSTAHPADFRPTPAGYAAARLLPPYTSIARGDGSRWVTDPSAPRRREQARTAQAGGFHRKQVVASGDARAAHVHHIVRAMTGDRPFEFLAQRLR